MEKQRRAKNPIELEEKEAFASVSPVNYNIDRVKLRSLVAANIIYKGEVSGETYNWPHAGSVVSVDSRDAPGLIARRLGKHSCCGNADGNHVFELIEEY